jgi:hypothetical protein
MFCNLCITLVVSPSKFHVLTDITNHSGLASINVVVLYILWQSNVHCHVHKSESNPSPNSIFHNTLFLMSRVKSLSNPPNQRTSISGCLKLLI